MSQIELHEQALVRSQSGLLAGVPFICTPSLRRPDSNLNSSVCCFSDASGVLYPCVLPVAGAAVHSILVATTAQPARMQGFWDGGCREAGARVSTNVRVQDMDLSPRGDADNRRIEVVADGLPLFHGAQLAIDTTLVSPLSRNGAAKRQCAGTDSAAMVQARRRKERTYPGLAQAHGRARLVVLACEVGGRWYGESLRFLHFVAEAKVRDEPEEFRDLVKRAWMKRWSSLLACTAARAHALSLLERRCAPSCDVSGARAWF